MARNSCSVEDSNLSAIERDARRQVRELRNFYSLSIGFLVLTVGLAAINLLTTPNRLWFYWPLLGGSIVISLRALSGFVRNRWLGVEWEERKLRTVLAAKSVK